MKLTPSALALAEAAGHPMAEHSRSVAELAGDVAVELGLDHDAREEIQIAALFHDLGKLAIMDEILYKPEGLTEQEIAQVRQHPVRGQRMLERADAEFSSIAAIVRSSHERWDGSGYPDGLEGEEIPVAARIIYCCDAYDAMTADRPYSRAIGQAMAIQELWACAGTQFDPEVVAALVRATAGARTPRSPRLQVVGDDAAPAPVRARGAAGDPR